MHFRCVQCRALTKVEVSASGAVPLSVPCSKCGRRYRLTVDRPRGKSDQERYHQALEYAEANQIDLASAYVVLEGIRTLEEARPLSAGEAPTSPILRVEDYRITIKEALLQEDAGGRRAPQDREASISHGLWKLAVFGTGALILAGLTLHFYQSRRQSISEQGAARKDVKLAVASIRGQPEPPPGATPPKTPPATVTKRDAAGQLVEVLGPDPASVLLSYLANGRQRRREAVGIAPGSPPSGSVRVGLFRDLEQPDTPVRAVRIRQDPRHGRWVIGDGRNPIMTEEPPMQPSDTYIAPVKGEP